jgi:hypothetical protein
LVIDFFGDSRRTGEPGSSLTTTVFTQSFIGLIFAAIFLPEDSEHGVAYLAANLSLSTVLIGIGMLGDPKRSKRQRADEFLVHTAPLSSGTLTLARGLHSSLHLGLVTTGMAIPPAVLAYWACGHRIGPPLLYLVAATVVAGILAGTLALITQLVRTTLGAVRAELVAGTARALLLGGGFAGFALCLPHLSGTAEELPIGRIGAMLWPPYWAAQIIDQPLGSGLALGLLAGTIATLFVGATLLNRMRRRRVQRRGARPGLLARLGAWLAVEGPLLGVSRFVTMMLYRSPGFRARVLPLFGMPAAMVLLSLWELEDPRARALLLGMTLQFPAIFLPFLIAFLPRSDQEQAGWIFHTCPHQDMGLYRTASLVALCTHILLPVQATACVTLMGTSGGSLRELDFAIALPLFSVALGVLVAASSLGRLGSVPFTRDGADSGADMEYGNLMGLPLLLPLAGGAFAVGSAWAPQPLGLLAATAFAAAVLAQLRRRCREH